MVLVAFAFLAAPLQQAAAQEPARPEPRELWREFPLDPPTQPSDQEAPAERGGAPVSAPTDRDVEAEGSGGWLSEAWIAAIVLAAALVLYLTVGALTYAARGRLDLGVGELRRRLPRPFAVSLAVARPARIAGPQFALATRAPRQTMRAGAAQLREMRHTAAILRKRIVRKAAALMPNFHAPPVPADTESTANEPGTVKDNVALHLPPLKREISPAAVPERLEAKAEASTSPADDELEILKAKLARSAAPAGVERPDEVETLKAKLGGDAAATDGDTSGGDVLKTKLVERDASAKSLPRETTDVASLKAKLDVRDEAASDHAPKSIDVDPPEATADEPQARRAAGQRPVSRGRGPSASRGATAAAPRQGSNRAERSALAAAPHLEPVPSPSPLLASPLRLEEPQQRPSECRIDWWRGYVKSAFHAVMETTAGGEELVAESSLFRWRKPEPPPQSGPAAEAHRALVELLQREGWSVSGAGEHWFALQLQRPSSER